MSGYLLDTNVISMLAPNRSAPAGFGDWLRSEDAEGRIYLSAVSIHEIERGIVLLDRKGATAQAAQLRTWFSGLISIYEDRILPVDTAVGATSGQLEGMALAAGHAPGMADALIAGTAKALELTVVTRNGRPFAPFRIPLLAPEECGIDR